MISFLMRNISDKYEILVQTCMHFFAPDAAFMKISTICLKMIYWIAPKLIWLIFSCKNMYILDSHTPTIFFSFRVYLAFGPIVHHGVNIPPNLQS